MTRYRKLSYRSTGVIGLLGMSEAQWRVLGTVDGTVNLASIGCHGRRQRVSGPDETLAPNRYAGHRFPPEIISHAVWLYFRFPLSLRMVEEMLAARGIVVSHEAVRQ